MNDRLIYRLKPARTEAIQLTGINEKDIDMFCFPEYVYYYHYLVMSEVEEGKKNSEQKIDCVSKDYKYAEIRCHDGLRTASVGDWLIRGIDGEIYIIKDNTFRALFTFEKKLHSF